MHLRNSCTRSTSACCMRQVPSGASGGRGVNGLIFFLTRKFHDTSVTRSRTCGKARIGSIVTGCSRSSSLSRVMHISRGLPLISAEQEPHLPALQFQRTARSLACSAWIWWTASSTTMPSRHLGRVVLEARRRRARRARSETSPCVMYFFSSMICLQLRAASAGSARGVSCMAPSAPAGEHDVERAERRILVRDSRRGSARRGSPCARAPRA